MKIAIIDDIQSYREELKDNLSLFFNRHYMGMAPIVDEFESAEDFLPGFQTHSYDLILLDYYMKEIDGLTAAREIREKDSAVSILFITTSPDYAVDSYQVRACGYLLKPFEYEDLEHALILARIQEITEGQFLELAGEKLLLKEIVYCDRDGHYVQLHTGEQGVKRFRMSFEALTELLFPYPWFLSCYRGCIVNMKRVRCLNELDFEMDTGQRVAFRKKERAEIEKRYSEFLFEQLRRSY